MSFVLSRILRLMLLLNVALVISEAHADAQDQSLPRMCRALHKKKSKRMLLKNPRIEFNAASDDVLASADADLHIVFVTEDASLDSCIRNIPDHCLKSLKAVCKHVPFKGRLGEQYVLTVPHSAITRHHAESHEDEQIRRIAFIGLGKPSKIPHERLEQVRRAVGYAMRVIESSHAYKIALEIPQAEWCADVTVLAREMVVSLMMASYSFDTYFSTKSLPSQHYSITLHGAHESYDAIRRGIVAGINVGYAVNQARYWSDSPPSVATPRYMADQAELLAAGTHLTCTIFDHHQIKAMGMGGLSAVSQGSLEPCRFVILEYRSTKPQAQTIALVGKGVTFDSGGISIKPSDHMEDMKHDMAGAAAIMAAMEVIAQMQPEVNVIALLPFTENMPSGSAVKPSDIVRFYNGVTAEIKNTDAEGRLILADALSYAVKHCKPDVIIDMATLTGSCMFALGKFFAGLMTEHYDVGNLIIEAACRSGDKVWVLPLHADYKPAVKSSVADIANLGHGSYYAGAITAACFLQYFVGNVPWVHIDIAGTAWDVPMSYYKSGGASGFGVKLLIDFVMNYPTNV